MDEQEPRFLTNRSRFKYWAMYTSSIFCLVIPTLLITLGLTGICSALFETSQSNFVLPSALVASISVCSMDLISDGKLDGKIDFKDKTE